MSNSEGDGWVYACGDTEAEAGGEWEPGNEYGASIVCSVMRGVVVIWSSIIRDGGQRRALNTASQQAAGRG